MEKLTRILHVDDDEDIRQITKLTLELVGHYEVTQFASGVDAINNVHGLKPQLFLLDVMMPDMSGEDTMRQLLALPGFESVPTVFMTAKAERESTERLMRMGARAVIVKPFDPMTLCAEIESAWQDGFAS